MWHIGTKTNEILTHAIKWMNIENILQDGRNQ